MIDDRIIETKIEAMKLAIDYESLHKNDMHPLMIDMAKVKSTGLNIEEWMKAWKGQGIQWVTPLEEDPLDYTINNAKKIYEWLIKKEPTDVR